MSAEYYPSDSKEKPSEKKLEPKKMKAFLISKEYCSKLYTQCVFIDLDEFNKTPYHEHLFKNSQTKNLHHGSIVEIDQDFKNITEYHMEHSYQLGIVLGNDKGSLLVYSKPKGKQIVDVNHYVVSDVQFTERRDLVLLNKSERGNYYIAHNITMEKMKHDLEQLTR
jgi:hypothetical protein